MVRQVVLPAVAEAELHDPHPGELKPVAQRLRFGRDGADESRWFVSSKGHSDGHRVLLPDETNLYWQAARKMRSLCSPSH